MIGVAVFMVLLVEYMFFHNLLAKLDALSGLGMGKI